MQFFSKHTSHWRYLAALMMPLLLVVLSASADSTPDKNKPDNSKEELERAVSLVEDGKYSEAFALFQKMAETGDPEAQHNLALLYRTGKGVEKNLNLSGQWFRKAADQGVSDAQYYLGHMYDTGEGVDQNRKYAYVWYRKAAEKGHGLAQINLGVLYANGLGIQTDIEQAYLWFHVAAAQGYRAAFENRKIIEEALEPEKLEALKKEARLYFQKYVLPYQRHSSAYPQLRQ